MSGAAPARPCRVVVSVSALPRAASAATTANWTAVKPMGRPKGAARPVMTTWIAQNRADSATSQSP